MSEQRTTETVLPSAISAATPNNYGDAALTCIRRGLDSGHLSATVLLLSSLLIFAPLIEGGTTQGPILVMRLLVLGSALVWIWKQMKRGMIVMLPSRLVPALALFVAWAGCSIGWAPYKNASVQWLMTLLMYSAVFVIVLCGIRTGRQVRQILIVVIGMGIGEGLFGIAQYAWLGEARASGTFFNPNFFATYEVMALAIMLGVLSEMDFNELTQWRGVLLWAGALVALVAFVCAQSRGALIGLLATVLFIGCYRFGKAALALLLVGLIVGVAIPNPLKQRALAVSTEDPYAFSRIDIWKNSIERVMNHPAGIGLGMYKYGSFQYRFPIDHDIIRYGKRAESAHSGYLQVAVELGAPGLAILFLGLGLWAMDARKALRQNLKRRDRGAVIGMTGAVVGMLIHGLVDSAFHEPALVLLLIVCGTMVCAVQANNSGHQEPWSFPFKYGALNLTLVALCGLALTVLIIQPATGWYAYQQGQREDLRGQRSQAMEWYRRASLIDPGVTAYHDTIARTSLELFRQSGNAQWLMDAIEHEGLAIDLNSIDGRFPYRLGTVYEISAEQKVSKEQQQYLRQQAVGAFQLAIQNDPYSPAAYMELGKIYAAEGSLNDAKRWLLQATAIEPNFLPARLLYAELCLQSGDRESARSAYNEITAIKKKYEHRDLSVSEQHFLDVDLYPLGRALSLEVLR